MKLIPALILIVAASACVAQAKPTATGDKLDCSNITISPQLDACVKQQMQKSNALLLSEMKNFQQRTLRAYAPAPELGKELIDLVRKSQEAWMQFRQLNCRVEAFQIEEGTAAHVTIVNDCIIRMNKQRIEVLKKLPQ